MRLPQTDFARYAAEGEEAAFRAVVAGHLPMVLAVAQRRLGEHAHLASDVAQAVFTRLARVAKGLPPDMSVAAWLHRQAVRLAIDTVRKETRRRSRETTAALLNAPDISPAPPPWEHLAPLLDEALDRLSASDRAALVLRYLEDRDFAEVGKALGSTPEAARKRIARGLEKLRSLLAQRGVTLSISALAALLLANKSGAASAGLMATICNTALSSTSAGWKGSVLLSLLRSHLTAVGVGAVLMLLVAVQIYKHINSERDLRVLAETPTSAATLLASLSTGPGPGQESGGSISTLTLDEIIAALRRITEGPDSRLAGLRTEALLNLVQPGQYAEFFSKGTASILQPRWKGIVDKASLLWRSRDPEALVKGLVEADNGDLEVIHARIYPTGIYRLNTLETKWFSNGEGKMESRLGALFDDWLQLDFEGAVRWLESQRDTPLMQLTMMDATTYYETLLRTAAAGMSASAPASTLHRVAQASQDPAAF